tara:strand:+ start:1401 stop:2753 length:1353 start_codon:yes stop_codon:yes gene_type:complete
MIAYIAEEHSHWASHCERLLGVISLDRIDSDYSWMLLARDQNGCFRCANLGTGFPTAPRAEEALLEEIDRVVRLGDIDTYGVQGDETNAPLNLLNPATDLDTDKLHPYFRLVLEEPGRAPARKVFEEIGPWLAPQDPHLVSEFQTKGFDQRLWEIYLWAAFREFNLDVEHLEAPDFRCRGPGIDFCVEATTAAPSLSGALAEHPMPKTIEETASFLDDYMPIKYGSALYTKLTKTDAQDRHYWEREDSSGKPFLLAIADFHLPAQGKELGSMTYTQSALWQYLYGSRVYWEMEGDQLVIKPEEIGSHKFGEKEIPSGFFDQPNAENISAVIFSNAGTLAKFDRMGVAAGFGAEGYRYMRTGFRYNPDPNAFMGTPFSEEVTDQGYEEYWTQEVQVFHNPNAKHPLPFEWLLGATHHYFEDGFMKSHAPLDSVLSSFTLILKIIANEKQAV